jgi:hypothetical protein
MKENKNRDQDHDHRHDEDDDQLRDNTMNETIREVRGDRDLNEVKNNRRDQHRSNKVDRYRRYGFDPRCELYSQ